MKILFTGGSSFTGYWFVKELVSAGHEVWAVFRRNFNEHVAAPRRERVQTLTRICAPVFGVSFGDDQFIKLVKDGHFDLLCHHAAEATDYKSPDFNVAAAVESNTRRLPLVLDLLRDAGCRKIVLTGSVFENDEGAGSGPLEAFSPYGLSKGLTWQLFRFYSQIRDVSLGKFVIPNPFGPYEEARFTHYLMKSWFAGVAPSVNTPSYVRDNIHVSLLAKAYVRFASSLSNGVSRINPSGYIESQGSFAHRVAREMKDRLGLKCELVINVQTDFSEPYVRINTDEVDVNVLNWHEKNAWDEFADYYSRANNNPPNQ
jgi:nucleoside-diphosphate-sugar epimerase